MRKKDLQWDIGENDLSDRFTWDQIKVSLLLDLRDELKELNQHLSCRQVQKMFRDLVAIRRNTNKKRRKAEA